MRKKVEVIIIGLILILTHSVFSQNITEPPFILSVQYSPQNPKENEKINFTTEVKPFSKESGKLKVYLYYSSDNGKNYENIEMQNKNNIYTVTLNGFTKNTEIIYSVKVLDENNLSSVQIPIINNISNTDFKPDNLPVFSPSVIDEDTENNLLPELNIDEFALGYGESENKKLLYGVVKMKGEVKGGTMSPTSINAFGILLMNPDITADKSLFDAFVEAYNYYVPNYKFLSIGYIPLLQLLLNSEFSDYGNCLAVDDKPVSKQPIPINESFLKCYGNLNSFYWLINYLLLGKNLSKSILFLTMTTISKTTNPDDMNKCNSDIKNNLKNCYTYIDFTPLTRFYLPAKNQIIKIAE